MTIRARLILAFSTILALFAVTQTIQVASDRERTQTIRDLERALQREVLIGNIRQRIADQQRQVALLSQVEAEPGRAPEGRDLVTAEMDRVTSDIRRLLALSDPADKAAVKDLQDTYAKLSDAWGRFYDYLGVDAAWATAFQVRAEPFGRHILLEKTGLLATLQEQQTARVQEAQARFAWISTATHRLDLGIFAASMLV